MLHHPSQGMGDDRHLQIYAEAAWQRLLAEGLVGATKAAAAEAAAGSGQRGGGAAEREMRQRVKQLWNWCQRDGLFNYSQGARGRAGQGGAGQGSTRARLEGPLRRARPWGALGRQEAMRNAPRPASHAGPWHSWLRRPPAAAAGWEVASPQS
jgi:hypothetical protein